MEAQRWLARLRTRGLASQASSTDEELDPLGFPQYEWDQPDCDEHDQQPSAYDDGFGIGFGHEMQWSDLEPPGEWVSHWQEEEDADAEMMPTNSSEESGKYGRTAEPRVAQSGEQMWGTVGPQMQSCDVDNASVGIPDQALGRTGNHVEDENAVGRPESRGAPRDDPDPWAEHPAGPQGSWLRHATQESWAVLEKVVGRQLFNPPNFHKKGENSKPKSASEAAAAKAADALREELQHTSPAFAPQQQFGGAVPGYIFTTRLGKTGYFADNSAPPPQAIDHSAPDRPPIDASTPVTISLDAHVMTNEVRRTSRSEENKKKKHQRHRFVGPLLPPASVIATEQNDWKDQGLVAIDSVNGNSFASTEFLRKKSAADAILIQETKMQQHKLEQLQAEARGDGWRAEATAAVKGAGNSSSCGTAILV